MTNTKRLGRFATFNNDNFNSPPPFDHLSSFKDTGWTSPLDWDKPLFSRRGSSLEKLLARASKTAEKSRKFLNKVESKRQSSINRAKSIPENATIRKEYVKCGKVLCYHGKHGPYYYAYWKDSETKKLRKKYIGTHMPESKGMTNDG